MLCGPECTELLILYVSMCCFCVLGGKNKIIIIIIL